MPRPYVSTAISTDPPSITVGAMESAVEGGAEYTGGAGVGAVNGAKSVLNKKVGQPRQGF